MTSQADQIQTLINQIDEVLSKTSPRLPWVMNADVTQQRQVLEQTRNYLIALQQQPRGFGSSLAQVPNQGAQTGQGSAESAQQVLQAVLQEMNYLRVNMMQPLRKDLELLQQQRNALTQEIRQLEAQRQQSLAAPAQVNQQMLNEFLQTMMAQMQENLSEQVARIMADWESQARYDRSLPEGGDRPALSPSQRLAQLQMIQSQSDELMLKLDSTLRVIFESLQNNVQGYESSLSQGLDRMNTLGQQGEAMFAALVSRLAHHLGREASSYLQGSGNRSPVAGAEALNPEALRRSLQASDVMLTNAEIDSLLEELTAGEGLQQSTSESTSETAAPGFPPAPAISQPDDADFDDLLNLDLDNLDLEATPTGNVGATPFQDDQPLTTIQDDEDEDDLLFQLDDLNEDLNEDVTQIQTGEDPVGMTPMPGELASAFDLLDQLSTELQEDEPTDRASAPSSAPTNADRAASEMGVSEMGVSEMGSEPAAIDTELDDFYRSFFEAEGDPTGGSSAGDERQADADYRPFAQPVAEAESPPQWEAGEAFDPAPFAQPVAKAEAPGRSAMDDALVPPAPEMPPLAAEDAGDAAVNRDRPDEVNRLIEDALFGGEPEPEAADFASATPEDRMSRSLEEFLFSRDDEDFPPAFPGVETTDSVIPGELTPGQQSPAEEIETISLLSDLIATPDLEPLTAATEAPAETSDTLMEDFGEEDYIAASPDEDLLGEEPDEPEAKVDLRLAADTLQQLTQDLSNLEGLDSDDISFLSVDLSAIEDTEEGISAAWATADIRTSGSEIDLEPDLEFDSELDLEFELEPEREPERELDADFGADLSADFGADFGADLEQELDRQPEPGLEWEPDLQADLESSLDADLELALEPDLESALRDAPEGFEGTEPPELPETVDRLFDDFTEAPEAPEASEAPDVEPEALDEAFDHDLDDALSNALTFEDSADFEIPPDLEQETDAPSPPPAADDLDTDWDRPAPTGRATEGSAFLTELFRSLEDDAIAPEEPRVTNEGLMREAEQAADAMLDDFFSSLVADDDPLPPIADRPTELEPSLGNWLTEDDPAEGHVTSLNNLFPPDEAEPEGRLTTDDLFFGDELPQSAFAETTPEGSRDADPGSSRAIADDPVVFLDDLFSQPEAQEAPPARYSTEANLLTLDDFADSLVDEPTTSPPPDSAPTPVLTSEEPSLENLFAAEEPATSEEPSLENLFGTEEPATSEPATSEPVTSEEPSLENLFAAEEPAAPAPVMDRESNAFTLEGLDNLFEDLPDMETAPPASSADDAQALMLEDIFGDDPQETQFQPPAAKRTDEQAALEALDDLFATELDFSSSEEDEKKNDPGRFPGRL